MTFIWVSLVWTTLGILGVCLVVLVDQRRGIDVELWIVPVALFFSVVMGPLLLISAMSHAGIWNKTLIKGRKQ